jgi:hypothetical protein
MAGKGTSPKADSEKRFWPGTDNQAKCQVAELVRHRDETDTTARKPFAEEEFHK